MDYELLRIYKKELTIEDAEILYKTFNIATIYHNGKVEFVED